MNLIPEKGEYVCMVANKEHQEPKTSFWLNQAPGQNTWNVQDKVIHLVC